MVNSSDDLEPLNDWGWGTYLYICGDKPSRQSISKKNNRVSDANYYRAIEFAVIEFVTPLIIYVRQRLCT